MDEAKNSLAERLKTANNVLVTVSRDPSVDQLSALLGLGLFLNKEGKHSAAVFSGNIPSTLEFLKPESTIQKNTDSLRDFIIALDKNKADKLRYKVEDSIVRIFITPYKSSIGQEDLEFSQGDFNVDVIVALGVSDQADLDEAITAHGRILHDATVASINVGAHGNLGSINWNDPSASSLSELVTELIQEINPQSLDAQIATALLTGIVATTDRFSNDKTTAKTMNSSSLLMAAGANQQLVATELEQPEEEVNTEEPKDEPEVEEETKEEETHSEPGTLEIEHDLDQLTAEDNDAESDQTTPNLELPEPKEDLELPTEEETNLGLQMPAEEPEAPSPELPVPPSVVSNGPKLVTEPPTLGGTLTANSTQNDLEPATDPLSMPASEAPTLLDHKTDTTLRAPFKPLDNLSPVAEPPAADNLPQLTPPPTSEGGSGGLPQLTPPPANWTSPATPQADTPATPSDLTQVHIDDNGTLSPIGQNGTLDQLEESVKSPHVEEEKNTNEARAAVDEALSSGPDNSLPTPSPSLNAQPLGPELHPADSQSPPPVPPPFNPAVQ